MARHPRKPHWTAPLIAGASSGLVRTLLDWLIRKLTDH